MERLRKRVAIRLLIGVLAVPLSLPLISACGFKMRTSTAMPFQKLYTNFAANSAIGADFKRLLRSEGKTEFVDKAADAQLSLLIVGELREREIVGFSPTGRPSQYQLRLKFQYRLADAKSEPVGELVEIILRRDISTNDALLNAKQQEEAMLYTEMQDDMVQQLIRRLSVVKLKP